MGAGHLLILDHNNFRPFSNNRRAFKAPLALLSNNSPNPLALIPSYLHRYNLNRLVCHNSNSKTVSVLSTLLQFLQFSNKTQSRLWCPRRLARRHQSGSGLREMLRNLCLKPLGAEPTCRKLLRRTPLDSELVTLYIHQASVCFICRLGGLSSSRC